MKRTRSYTMAIVALGLSGLSDALDGMIARHFNQITELGKMLDPLADKLTQGTVAICIAVQLAVILMAIVLRFTDWYILDPLLSLAISFFILSKAIPRFWSTLKIFLDAVPEGVDIKQVKNDLEQLDNVASINQLNLWTMDGLEKNAIVHVCLEHVKHIEVCKESIRDLLKESGFQNVTIEVDEDLATHQAHKRNIEELEAESEQQHHH